MSGLDASVQVAIVTGGFGVLAALAGVLTEVLRRQGKAIGEVKEHASLAREQVQNSHTSTNLRDDVDRLLTGLDRVLDGQSRQDEALRQYDRELDTVRRDLHQERDERLAVEMRLDNHLASNTER